MNPLALTPVATVAVGAGIVLLLILIGVLYAVLKDRRPRQAVPANLKPYLDDDDLETSRLERVLSFAVWGLVVCALLLGYYFVTEPGRQAAAFDDIEHQRELAGAKIYGPTTTPEGHAVPGAAGCQNCHGADGGGGSTKYTPKDPVTGATETESVSWICPPLNTVFLKYSEDQIRTIITYGRPNTPMPAWGIAGGGPESEQQIEDVMVYLRSIQLTPDEAKAKSDENLQTYKDTHPGVSEPEALFDTNCARCHTIGYSYGQAQANGSGGYGPTLRNGATLSQFGAVAPVLNPAGTHAAYVVQTGALYQPVTVTHELAPKAAFTDADVVVGITADPGPYVPDTLNPESKAFEFSLSQGPFGLLVQDPELDEAAGTPAVTFLSEPAKLVPLNEPNGSPVLSNGRQVYQVLINKGLQDQIDFVTKGSQWQQAYGVRGLGQGRMPGFGNTLSTDQIEEIVTYERGL